MRSRVVVTGMGIVAPNGHGLEDYERALREGRSGIRYIPRLKDLNFACLVGGIPENFGEVLKRYFRQEDMIAFNDNIAFASVAAIDAWRDGGFEVPDFDSRDVDWDSGAIMGSGIGGMDTIAEAVVPLVNQGKVRRLGSTIVEQVMNSATSAKIAGLLALGNQVTSNSSACSTGNEAIIDALYRIRHGMAKRILAGGSEGSSPFIWAGFDAMRVLNRKSNDQPRAASRPMSASAGGFIPGSGGGALLLEDLETAKKRRARIYAEVLGGAVNCGGGALLLEDLETAKKRRARIYAEVLGGAVNCGGHRNGGTMTAPNPEGVMRCIRTAVADAGISPRDVDAVNGHLTATFADPVEVKNWAQALERTPGNFPYINSTKSMVGHCLGGAGAVECVAVVLQLHKGFLHPSINCEDIHPDIAQYAGRIPPKALELPNLKLIAKAGFGFGDVNSCIIFKKWEG